MWGDIKAVVRSPAGKQSLIIFLSARLFLSVWAILILQLNPFPIEPDELLRPYYGEPALNEGVTGHLLGPWQRFDTNHYLTIAREGYSPQNSVFPPLYPMSMRGLGQVMGAIFSLSVGAANLLAGLLVGNMALLALLILLHHIAATELDKKSATRTLVYLMFFPTGWFLLTAYTESLFLFFAVASIWSAKREKFLLAGFLGLLASLTRLTGWVLVVPLVYEYARQRAFNWRKLDWRILVVGLPAIGSAGFLLWRASVGLPPINAVYDEFWRQVTGFPGRDFLSSTLTIITGTGARAGEFPLYFDYFCTIFLAVITVVAFRRFGATYGLYCLMLLLFILLPTSDVKPLYSFSRYTLAFFPAFMILGDISYRPWVNRLLFYPSILLYLYFSGQFIVWGWVA